MTVWGAPGVHWLVFQNNQDLKYFLSESAALSGPAQPPQGLGLPSWHRRENRDGLIARRYRWPRCQSRTLRRHPTRRCLVRFVRMSLHSIKTLLIIIPLNLNQMISDCDANNDKNNNRPLEHYSVILYYIEIIAIIIFIKYIPNKFQF